VHAVAHSLGARVVLQALPHLPAGAVGRLILLAGAEFGGRAAEALDTPAGRCAEVINVTSRENDLFDFLLECLIPPPVRGNRSLGLALPSGPGVLNLQMDHPGTLAALRGAGFEIGAPMTRICHWSPYTRPGALAMYDRLLREAAQLPLAQLRAALPDGPTPRWSRLLPRPAFLPAPGARVRAGM
jgi:pimeloyl-ACP methyl ester carboxylesterase